MRETIMEATAGDGYPLKYRSWQTGESDALVVTLHGLLTHSGWFSGLGDALLERRVHVIGHDRRGSGLNVRDRGDVDAAQRLLDDLGAVVEGQRSRYRTVVYLGWCLGATVALHYLLQHPEMGEGLILMSPDVFERHRTRSVQRLFAGPEWAHRVLPRLTVPIPTDIYTDTTHRETFVRRDTLRLRDFTPRFMGATVALQEGLEARLRAFHKPSLLVLAGRDQIIDNARTRELYARIGTECREVLTFDCNHGIMFEALDDLVEAVARFVERLAGLEAA